MGRRRFTALTVVNMRVAHQPTDAMPRAHNCGMTSASSTWRFVREHSLRGMPFKNRVSTDALDALRAWQEQDTRRSYEVIEGEEADDSLVAFLSTDSDDRDAGPALDRACEDHRVERLVEA